jgi:hypothetical protein
VQLVDGLADHPIWTEHYDSDTIDSFAVQDDICAKAAAAVEPQLYRAEYLCVQRKSPANLSGWECIVRALSLMNSRDQKNVATARALLQKAVVIDPASAQARGNAANR